MQCPHFNSIGGLSLVAISFDTGQINIEWAEGRNPNGDFQVLEWFDHFMQ